MLFTIKSYRAFVTLVSLFLLAVQVIAVPPTVRRPPTRQNVGTAHRNPNNALRAALRDATHSRMKAKQMHLKVQSANRDLAQKHERFAMGLPQPQRSVHLHVAQRHKATALFHKSLATAHGTAAETHRNLRDASLAALRHSKHTSEKSLWGAKFVHRHTKLLSSAMNAAKEHRIASTMHHEAAQLADHLGHPAIEDRHREHAQEHMMHAYHNANFAVNNVRPRPLRTTVGEGIRIAQDSAREARFSNLVAQASMQRISNAQQG